MKANTALIPPTDFLWFKIPRGKALAAELAATARILDGVKRQWVQSRLMACGYPSDFDCDINLTTGRITASQSAHDTRVDS